MAWRQTFGAVRSQLAVVERVATPRAVHLDEEPRPDLGGGRGTGSPRAIDATEHSSGLLMSGDDAFGRQARRYDGPGRRIERAVPRGHVVPVGLGQQRGQEAVRLDREREVAVAEAEHGAWPVGAQPQQRALP